MKMMLPRARNRALRCVLAAGVSFTCAGVGAAQVSPNEILNPQLKALEAQYFPQLKTINQQIARAHFPFPFYLSRVVGLDPSQQVEADTRGLEFRNFRDRVVLKATGNYNAAYDSRQLTRNERAARTFRDVMLPLLQIVTQNIPPDVDCDAIGFEVAYHVRDRQKSYDYEGQEILVVVLDRKDAFQMILEKDDNARQKILNQSLVYLGGQEYGLSLLDRDPMMVDAQARAKSTKIDATSTAGSSTSASRLIRSNPNLMPSAAPGSAPDASATIAPKVDLSLMKPAATPVEAEKLQAQYQAQLDVLANEGQARLSFVDYDPPTFVVVSKQMVLQMTLKNSTRFDPDKTNIYKRAAQTFDLFVAPKMKDILDRIPSDLPVDYYDFSVVNPLTPTSLGKERSEAIEFLFPKNLAQRFANTEITNQELIDKSQVLVNGVRIALNLQLVE
ncbi:MAG TPA: hypothetical protein VED66_07035 [Candidatus Sulfotelmatobacter sp.]|nr:hypothetical protein [Candidatus Sulfotelmatobacter sp.]